MGTDAQSGASQGPSARLRHALDLSADGIGLFLCSDLDIWQEVDRVPLQLGQVGAGMARLRAQIGGPKTVQPPVDVWLPAEQLLVAARPEGGIPETASGQSTLFGAAPQPVALDIHAPTNPTAPNVAAMPLSILTETVEFLEPHGFQVSGLSVRGTPEGLHRPPRFAVPKKPAAAAAPWPMGAVIGLAAAAVAILALGTTVFLLNAPEAEQAAAPVDTVRQIALAPDFSSSIDRYPGHDPDLGLGRPETLPAAASAVTSLPARGADPETAVAAVTALPPGLLSAGDTPEVPGVETALAPPPESAQLTAHSVPGPPPDLGELRAVAALTRQANPPPTPSLSTPEEIEAATRTPGIERPMSAVATPTSRAAAVETEAPALRLSYAGASPAPGAAARQPLQTAAPTPLAPANLPAGETAVAVLRPQALPQAAASGSAPGASDGPPRLLAPRETPVAEAVGVDTLPARASQSPLASAEDTPSEAFVAGAAPSAPDLRPDDLPPAAPTPETTLALRMPAPDLAREAARPTLGDPAAAPDAPRLDTASPPTETVAGVQVEPQPGALDTETSTVTVIPARPEITPPERPERPPVEVIATRPDTVPPLRAAPATAVSETPATEAAEAARLDPGDEPAADASAGDSLETAALAPSEETETDRSATETVAEPSETEPQENQPEVTVRAEAPAVVPPLRTPDAEAAEAETGEEATSPETETAALLAPGESAPDAEAASAAVTGGASEGQPQGPGIPAPAVAASPPETETAAALRPDLRDGPPSALPETETASTQSQSETDEDQPLVIVRPERPAITPPLRPEQPPVVVVAARPDTVPPLRPRGSAEPDEADEIAAAIAAASAGTDLEDEVEAAAPAGEETDGDLAPSPRALARAARPPARPVRETEIAAALAPSERALTQSPSPRARPARLAAVPAQTPTIASISRTVVPGTTVAPPSATPSRTRQPADRSISPGGAPVLPTTASVARAATIDNALPLRRLALVGVFGSESRRHALIRLANGRFVRVEPGDRVEGFNVASIGTSSIQMQRGGRITVLEIPE